MSFSSRIVAFLRIGVVCWAFTPRVIRRGPHPETDRTRRAVERHRRPPDSGARRRHDSGRQDLLLVRRGPFARGAGMEECALLRVDRPRALGLQRQRCQRQRPITSPAISRAGRVLERPKVISTTRKTKPYVMYMHIDSGNYREAKVGVATSPTVDGNYTYRGSFRPMGHQSRDMSLFQDRDGAGYLLFEDRQSGVRIERLSDDYLTPVAETCLIPEIVRGTRGHPRRRNLLPARLAPIGLGRQRQRIRDLADPRRPVDRTGSRSRRPRPKRTTRKPRSFSRSSAAKPPTYILYGGDRWNRGHDLG